MGGGAENFSYLSFFTIFQFFEDIWLVDYNITSALQDSVEYANDA